MVPKQMFKQKTMYFSNIQEIRDTFPLAIRLLNSRGKIIDYLPLKSVFVISSEGYKTQKTIDEMETLEKSLKSKSGLLTEVEKIFSNKIKSWH